MIDPSIVQKIGKIISFSGKTRQIVCHKINSLWELNESKWVVISLDNILVPWQVIEWETKGPHSLLFSLLYADEEDVVQNFLGNNMYMFNNDIKIINKDSPNSFSLYNMLHFAIIDEKQGHLGTIEKIDTSTTNTLVQTSNQLILPLLQDFIKNVDTEKKEIAVLLPFTINKN